MPNETSPFGTNPLTQWNHSQILGYVYFLVNSVKQTDKKDLLLRHSFNLCCLFLTLKLLLLDYTFCAWNWSLIYYGTWIFDNFILTSILHLASINCVYSLMYDIVKVFKLWTTTTYIYSSNIWSVWLTLLISFWSIKSTINMQVISEMYKVPSLAKYMALFA